MLDIAIFTTEFTLNSRGHLLQEHNNANLGKLFAQGMFASSQGLTHPLGVAL